MTYQEKYDAIIEALKTKAKEILPQGARLVLFGSRARGDYKEDSDWDLHILLPSSQKLTLSQIDNYAFPLEIIGWDFGEYFSTSVYSFSDWYKRRGLPFYNNVEKDKIILIPAETHAS
ncbi:MAG: nucleotidyltransferase domain-containing protein [Muribaculaceae bacterium]|nr:nucleotidyltransferase domain-containing protein [Muribaculaceae bacterium]